MTVWFVVAFPPLIMFFALAMERVESRLRHLAVHENEIEVPALVRSGIGRTLDLFRTRRRRRAALARSPRPRQRS